MSQTLNLASPLHTSILHHDDEDFLIFTSSNDDPDTETVSFADQLMDIDFPLLDINTRSTLLTLPTPIVYPSVNRMRSIWKNAMLTEELLMENSVKKSTSTGRGLAALDKDNLHVDVMSDSSSSVSSMSDVSSLSLDSIDSDLISHRSYTRFLRTSPSRIRSYPSFRDRRGSIDSTSSERRPQKERKKEGSFVNPREEMSMLRLSCTCQSRNTGKSLHLWEFLLEMLADRRMKSVIAWTGHAREFRVVNSREVAREWGNRKNKPHMNFDKMSRAMRYYYKKKILTHGNKQRLVYSFCPDAICPHYEKIIKLALKTRPPTQGSLTSCQTSPRQQPATVVETPSWDRASSPITYKTSSASLKLKNESEKILTEKLCPGRSAKWSVKRPAVKQEHCVTSCCQGLSCKLYQPRDDPVRPNKTLYRSPASRNSNSSNSNQPKIKINTSRPNYNDCFKFT